MKTKSTVILKQGLNWQIKTLEVRMLAAQTSCFSGRSLSSCFSTSTSNRVRSPLWIMPTNSSFVLDGENAKSRNTSKTHQITKMCLISHHLNCLRNIFTFKLFFGSMNVIYKKVGGEGGCKRTKTGLLIVRLCLLAVFF